MADYLVVLHYSPKSKKSYLVQDQPTQLAARRHVADKIILYDPGVPVDVTETPITDNPTYRYSNLGRFND